MGNLYIDAPLKTRQIEQFIRETASSLHRDGAIIAFSGGLDSSVAAVLTVRSLGKDKVKLVYMPDRDSNPVHKKHAIMLADELGCDFSIQNISPVLWKLGTYNTLRLAYIPTRYFRKLALKFGRKHLVAVGPEDYAVARLRSEASSLFSRTNAYMESKHRVRMAKIYQMAEVRKLMVVGAANRTEWMTGNFCQWGIDHCARDYILDARSYDKIGSWVNGLNQRGQSC
jgi:NAD+ synthase